MSTEQTNLEMVRRYFKALEDAADTETVASFFSPDVVQEEFPNRLVANGARRDLAALIEGNERGKKILLSQRFDIQRFIASGDSVALEVIWTGVLSIPLGSIPVGGEMRAHFGVFIDFKDGKIIGQRNYACFDPW